MKKGKVIAVVLVAVLLFVGCGANTTETEEEVVVTQSGNDDLLYAEFRDADGNFDFKGETLYVMWDPLEDLPTALGKIKIFEEECNAKVEIVSGGWGDLPAKLSSSVASGNPADVSYMYSTWYPDFLIADYLEPIDQYIPLMESLASEDDDNRFVYDETDYFMWNGNRYVFTNTNASTHSLLFYNTSMFDEMGLEYPYELEKKGEWTHEKFIEYAKILTMDKDGDGVIDQYGAFVELFMLTMLLTSNDTDIVQLGREKGEQTKLILRDPATLASLTAYDTMITDGSLGGDVTLGTAAMGFRGTWEIKNLNTNLGADGWGFSGAPIGPNNKTGVGAGIHSRGWSIIKGSKNPVMATVFIHYYLNVPSGVTIDEDGDEAADFLGFKDEVDYNRYLDYVKNLRKEDNHILEGNYYGFMYGIGGKPLATHIAEYEPELQAALDRVLSAAGVVMAGEGEPFETVNYEFETDIVPFVLNAENTTNASVVHTADKGGALSIKTDALAVWDLYATTDPEVLVFEPGHKYKVSFDYTVNEAIGEEGRYYLSFIVNGKNLSDTHYGFDAVVGEKTNYSVEFAFYDDLEGGQLKFGGFNTSDLLIENLQVETID